MDSTKIIRLRRKNRTDKAIFDIIVCYKYKRSNSDALERLGFFNPNSVTNIFFINIERLGYWLNNGAILTVSVKKVLSSFIK